MEIENEDIVRRGFTRDLPVPLSKDEVTAVGKRWAATLSDIDHLDKQKKDSAASFERKKQDAKAQAATLQVEYMTEKRIMPVECYERFVSGMIEIVRTDTCEVIDHRPANAAELQRDMASDFSEVWDDDIAKEASEEESEKPAKKKAKR